MHIFPNIYFRSRCQPPCAAHKMNCECVWLWRWIVSVLCVNGLLKAPLDRWFTKFRGETDKWTTPSIVYSAAGTLHNFCKCMQVCCMLTDAGRGKWGVLFGIVRQSSKYTYWHNNMPQKIWRRAEHHTPYLLMKTLLYFLKLNYKKFLPPLPAI